MRKQSSADSASGCQIIPRPPSRAICQPLVPSSRDSGFQESSLDLGELNQMYGLVAYKASFQVDVRGSTAPQLHAAPPTDKLQPIAKLLHLRDMEIPLTCS